MGVRPEINSSAGKERQEAPLSGLRGVQGKEAPWLTLTPGHLKS